MESKGEHANGTKSPILSAQDSGVVMQGRNGQVQSSKASIPSSGSGSSPTVKASPTSKTPKRPLPLKAQPMSHEPHPLLRLFMNHKSTSEEDISAPQAMNALPGPYPSTAPMTLTIPNLEEITIARLASRSPALSTMESNPPHDQANPSVQYQQQQYQASNRQPPETARIPFGLVKPLRSDRRPSAPILMNSAPSSEHLPYNHHALNRGPIMGSPITSPRAVPPPPQSSILANMHAKHGTQDPEPPSSLPPSSLPPANKGSFSHEIIIPSHHQVSVQQSLRPSSTPSSPAFPPTTTMGSTSSPANGAAVSSSNSLSASKDQPRLNGQRRPSPTMLSSMMSAAQQQQQQQQQQNRAQSDPRSNLPPAIPHRKGSLDFSQTERQSHLRANLPMRPPSAAAVRSATFHGISPPYGASQPNDSVTSLSTSLGSTIAGLSGIAALGVQPINISEEKLPPFGHSAAHLRMINALQDNVSAPTAIHEQHRASFTLSERDGLSPALNGDPTFGQMHSSSLPNHMSSLSSSSGSSISSASVPNSAATTGSFGAAGPGPSPGVVMGRPGLRTVGSSENFARRIRSASMLKRGEDQEGQTKSGFQSSRPPYSGQQAQQPTIPQGHYHQHPAYQQPQYPYSHEPHPTDIHRYRRASSPRRRSISMTNLNGGLSFIMVPPSKKSSVDDYAPNPLLLPPSPSTTRFIGSSSVGAPALSSSPLRPTLHSMASSSSLSSSFGSASGVGQANNGASNGAGHGPSSLSSSTNISTSPTSQPLVTNGGNQNSTNMSSPATISNANANPKSIMSIPNQSSGNVSTVSALVASASQHSLSQHLGSHPHHGHHHHQHQHHSNPHSHHAHMQQQPQNVPMHLPIATPEPRPLVLEAMRRNDDLLEELQMTVSDLSQWLDVFEMGIKSIRS
ncbi:hypothetical protein B0O80DRAFT_205271 [Mortierella sp. GBAus27b]|nr:hypothetical protein B0O80DRAFT_205271 [Mortierella sp. GBAus27b]